MISFTDENSELGMAELMAEAFILRAIHDKVAIAHTQPYRNMLSQPQIECVHVQIHLLCLTSACTYLHPHVIQAGTHPNIVSFLGMTAHGGFPCLLLEYVNHGTLDTFLWSLKKGPIPEWYLGFVRDTLRGVYPQHVSGDLMSILRQTVEGMVRYDFLCMCSWYYFIHLKY